MSSSSKLYTLVAPRKNGPVYQVPLSLVKPCLDVFEPWRHSLEACDSDELIEVDVLTWVIRRGTSSDLRPGGSHWIPYLDLVGKCKACLPYGESVSSRPLGPDEAYVEPIFNVIKQCVVPNHHLDVPYVRPAKKAYAEVSTTTEDLYSPRAPVKFYKDVSIAARPQYIDMGMAATQPAISQERVKVYRDTSTNAHAFEDTPLNRSFAPQSLDTHVSGGTPLDCTAVKPLSASTGPDLERGSPPVAGPINFKANASLWLKPLVLPLLQGLDKGKSSRYTPSTPSSPSSPYTSSSSNSSRSSSSSLFSRRSSIPSTQWTTPPSSTTTSLAGPGRRSRLSSCHSLACPPTPSPTFPTRPTFSRSHTAPSRDDEDASQRVMKLQWEAAQAKLNWLNKEQEALGAEWIIAHREMEDMKKITGLGGVVDIRGRDPFRGSWATGSDHDNEDGNRVDKSAHSGKEDKDDDQVGKVDESETGIGIEVSTVGLLPIGGGEEGPALAKAVTEALGLAVNGDAETILVESGTGDKDSVVKGLISVFNIPVDDTITAIDRDEPNVPAAVGYDSHDRHENNKNTAQNEDAFRPVMPPGPTTIEKDADGTGVMTSPCHEADNVIALQTSTYLPSPTPENQTSAITPPPPPPPPPPPAPLPSPPQPPVHSAPPSTRVTSVPRPAPQPSTSGCQLPTSPELQRARSGLRSASASRTPDTVSPPPSFQLVPSSLTKHLIPTTTKAPPSPSLSSDFNSKKRFTITTPELLRTRKTLRTPPVSGSSSSSSSTSTNGDKQGTFLGGVAKDLKHCFALPSKLRKTGRLRSGLWKANAPEEQAQGHSSAGDSENVGTKIPLRLAVGSADEARREVNLALLMPKKLNADFHTRKR